MSQPFALNYCDWFKKKTLNLSPFDKKSTNNPLTFIFGDRNKIIDERFLLYNVI